MLELVGNVEKTFSHISSLSFPCPSKLMCAVTVNSERLQMADAQLEVVVNLSQTVYRYTD